MNTKLEMEAPFFTLTPPNCHFMSGASIKDPAHYANNKIDIMYFLVIIMP